MKPILLFDIDGLNEMIREIMSEIVWEKSFWS